MYGVDGAVVRGSEAEHSWGSERHRAGHVLLAVAAGHRGGRLRGEAALEEQAAFGSHHEGVRVPRGHGERRHPHRGAAVGLRTKQNKKYIPCLKSRFQ